MTERNRQYPERVKKPIQKILFNGGVFLLGNVHAARAAEGDDFGRRSESAEKLYELALNGLTISVRKPSDARPYYEVKNEVSGLVNAERKRRKAAKEKLRTSDTIFKGTK